MTAANQRPSGALRVSGRGSLRKLIVSFSSLEFKPTTSFAFFIIYNQFLVINDCLIDSVYFWPSGAATTGNHNVLMLVAS
jgi:hypothetical protein